MAASAPASSCTIPSTVATIAVAGLGLARLLAPVSRLGPVLAALVVAYAGVVACHVWGRTLARVH